jgi:RNA polymerase sigma factor (sigma-70 family)
MIAKIAYEMGYRSNGSNYDQDTGMLWDDVIQAGRIGLWVAIQQYDAAKVSGLARNGLASFVWGEIRKEILRERDRSRWMKSGHTKEYRDRSTFHRRDSEDLERWADDRDVWRQIDDEQWLEKIDQAIAKQDFKRRNIYQGLMRELNTGRLKPNEAVCESLGICESRIYQYKHDIRKKLKAELN